MLGKIIEFLKYKKRELEDKKSCLSEVKEKESLLNFSEVKGFLKMEITDYIAVADYTYEAELEDSIGISDAISSSVLWNSKRQKVNKGIFFVKKLENKTYTFFLGDSEIKVDEREIVEKNIEERILTIHLDGDDYRYVHFKHDETGSTFYTKYYNFKISLGKLDLTLEDAYREISLLLERVEAINEIESVLDVEMLRNVVMADLKGKLYQKKK